MQYCPDIDHHILYVGVDYKQEGKDKKKYEKVLVYFRIKKQGANRDNLTDTLID